MFQVGQKIIFVGVGNGIFLNLPRRVDVPERGKVYTVREVFFDDIGKRVGIRLMEIRNPPEPFTYPPGSGLDGIEIGWVATEFRPLVERKTDISIFEKMLKPQEEKV